MNKLQKIKAWINSEGCLGDEKFWMWDWPLFGSVKKGFWGKTCGRRKESESRTADKGSKSSARKKEL